ncbi:MAG: porin family protein [Gemmatimonadaceae bacterium]
MILSPRTLQCLAALALTIAPATAARGQKVGFVLGRSVSDVVTRFSGNVGESYPDRHSIAAGVTYRHRLTPGVVLEPELLVVPRGWSSQSLPTLTMTYLELPVLLRIGAMTDGGWPLRPVLSVGPAVSWRLTCALDGTGQADSGSGCRTQGTYEPGDDYHIRRFDVSAQLGLALEARIAGAIVGLDGRYEYGLVDITPKASGHTRNGAFLVLFHFVPKQGPRSTGAQPE